MINTYPDEEPIEPTIDELEFLADYAEFLEIPRTEIMSYTAGGIKPAILPFIHPESGEILQVFFDEWRAEQRLIANIRYEDPSMPEGYWIDYTTAPNAEIILKELAGRTISLPFPPVDNWYTVHSYATFYDMSILNPPDPFFTTDNTLVGVTEEWDTFYRFENPDWPEHYFEFQTVSYHPNRWPKRAYYVYWRYYLNNSMWYWSTWRQKNIYGGILPSLFTLGSIAALFLFSGSQLSRRPQKKR